MSTTVSSIEQQQRVHSVTPSFFGMLRGELFKISRRWATWIMLVMLLGIICLPYLVRFTVPTVKDTIQKTPTAFFYSDMSSNLSVLRVFAGFVLIVLTAQVIGLEYQLGTIRVLLARGAGRLQLLAAKLLALVIIALLLFIGGILVNTLLSLAFVSVLIGNLNALNGLPASFWSDTQTYMLTILISMGATILMATAASVIGRSLTIGLSAALCWFAADNFGVIMMLLANRLTHNDFWNNATAYFLGPNLNIMPTALTKPSVLSIGITPLVNVDGNHTLLVTLVYALIFTIVSIVLTWRRDVKE